jgi:hypothetical protein
MGSAAGCARDRLLGPTSNTASRSSCVAATAAGGRHYL